MKFRALPLLMLLGAGLLLRLGLINIQGLWVDEVFSLAIASGHSLEHSAADFKPQLGDFPLSPQVKSAALWQNYLKPGANQSLSNVWRAVRLSDTNPPGYYYLLRGWLNLWHWSDAGLRLFSTLCWVLCLWPLWKLGRLFGGRKAARWTIIFACLSPMAIYYSAEGRMYALVWLLAVWLFRLAVPLHSKTGPWRRWALAAAAGLLTHYLFAFVLLACVLWLALRRPAARKKLALWAAVSAALVLPWYAGLPEDLSRFRVSQGWLAGRPPLLDLMISPLRILADFFSANGKWNDPDFLSSVGRGWPQMVQGAVILGAAGLLWLAKLKRSLPLVAWLFLGCAAPAFLDLLTAKHSSDISRYGLAALPAAWLLVGMAFSRLKAKSVSIVFVVLLLSWLPGLTQQINRNGRMDNPLKASAQQLISTQPGQLVLAYSIPSGVLGFSRYLDKDQALGSWVAAWPQGKNRDRLDAMLTGKQSAALVRIHQSQVDKKFMTWMNQRTISSTKMQMDSIEAAVYLPRAGLKSFPQP